MTLVKNKGTQKQLHVLCITFMLMLLVVTITLVPRNASAQQGDAAQPCAQAQQLTAMQHTHFEQQTPNNSSTNASAVGASNSTSTAGVGAAERDAVGDAASSENAHTSASSENAHTSAGNNSTGAHVGNNESDTSRGAGNGETTADSGESNAVSATNATSTTTGTTTGNAVAGSTTTSNSTNVNTAGEKDAAKEEAEETEEAVAEVEEAAAHERLRSVARARDVQMNTLSSSYDYTGMAYCEFRNNSVFDDVFFVTIDDAVYTGYCIDEGLPAPEDGWYPFYATWDDEEKVFYAVLDTTGAGVHSGQADIGLGCQRVGRVRIEAHASFTLYKTSANIEVPNTYTTEGAVYGLYWYYADAEAKAEPDYRLVIGADGASETITGLTPDDRWYIRELEAPFGYLLDDTIYTVAIRPNEHNTFYVSDAPIFDSVGIEVNKQTIPTQTQLDDNLSLAGAHYQFDYYTGYYTSVSDAQAHEKPARSWVMQTDEHGRTGLAYAGLTFTHEGAKHSYLVSGTPYVTQNGAFGVGLGTLIIHEIAAPYGYLTSRTYFISQLRSSDNERGYAWRHVQNISGGNRTHDSERVDVGSLVVRKKNANPSLTQGNASYSLAGAQFGVYNNAACSGLPTYTLVTNEQGETNTLGNLAPGSTWYIKELRPPSGFVASSTIYRASIVPGSVSTCEITVENAPVYANAAVAVAKHDSRLFNNNGASLFTGNASLQGAEYTFTFYAGKTAAQGTPSAVWVGTTNAQGIAYLATAQLLSGKEWLVHGKRVLPLGFLHIQETKAPYGYLMSDKEFLGQVAYDAATQQAVWVMCSSVAGKERADEKNAGEERIGDEHTETPDSNQIVFHDELEFIEQEDIKLFGIEVNKAIQGAAQNSENPISPEGIQFEIVYVPTGEVVQTLTLNQRGYASTGTRALPCGIYEVREVEASLPYGLMPYRITSGTNSNVVGVIDATNENVFSFFRVVVLNCTDYTYDAPHGRKLDHTTKQPIANTQFTLYRAKQDLVLVDGELLVNISDFDAYANYWEPVEVVATNAHGTFNFSSQPYGVYMVVETQPNWQYLSASETQADGLSANPLASARIFIIDKNHACELQLWEDIAIQLECDVKKETIAVTSAGLVSKLTSDAFNNVSNVGSEQYRYDVHFSNANTNTYADEFWVEDQLNMTSSPFDIRVTTIVLPTVQNDTIPTVTLLIRTNKSAHDTWTPLVEVACHESSLCDGSSRFRGAGWRLVGVFPSDRASTLFARNFGLAQDEYITGLCLYYGAVEQGFSTISPLSYMVVATHELPVGTVIPNTATSHISRNWAQRGEEEGGLFDDDIDSVTTTVLSTFVQEFERTPVRASGGYIGGWSFRLPQTADDAGVHMLMLLCFACAVAGLAAAVALGGAAIRRGTRRASRRGSCSGSEGAGMCMGCRVSTRAGKRAGGVLAVGIVVVLVSASAPMNACVQTAWAQTTQTQTAWAQTQTPTQTKTVAWLSTEPQPAFDETLEYNGTTYELVSSEIEAIDSQQESVEATHFETLSCEPSQLEATKQSFPREVYMENETHAGNIGLARIESEPVYAQRTWEVNETCTTSGLPSNDAAQIPPDYTYTNPDTQNTLTLRLAGLSWQVEAYDEVGLPLSYCAYALYRGSDTATLLDSYNVTAHYAGMVDSLEPVITYQATLSYRANVAPAFAAETTSLEEENTAAQTSAWAPLAAAAAAVVSVGFVVVWWYRRHDVRVCVASCAPARDQASQERLKVIARVRSKRSQDGSLSVQLPARVNLSAHRYVLLLAPYRANGCSLQVLQNNKLVTRTSALPVVRL